VDQRQIVISLLEKASKYRSFIRWVGDWETAQRISLLAEELKQRARALATPNEKRIRERAREIWEEMADHPQGTKSFGSKRSENFRRRRNSPKRPAKRRPAWANPRRPRYSLRAGRHSSALRV
jgi:hypothetical protein